MAKMKVLYTFFLTAGLSILLLSGFIFAQIAVDKPSYLDYNIVYESKTTQEPIYKEVCYDAKYQPINDTTMKAYCEIQVDYFRDVVSYTDKQIGISDGKEIIKDSNLDKGKIIMWTIPIGDRNFIEFPDCLDYEKDKSVCHEI